MPKFTLTLHSTYYSKGFFNIPVDFDRFVRDSEGDINLVLGNTGRLITGTLNRSANSNGTPRIIGGRELKSWFQEHYKSGDHVSIDLSSENSIRIG
jgi:hypothetical protein